MKNLYEITSKTGCHVCYQVADTPKEAVSLAKMYGHKKAANATLIREN